MALSNNVVFLVNDGIDNKKLKHSSLKTDLEGTFLPLTGGDIRGPVTAPVPSNPNDIAPKKYVDGEIQVIQEQLDSAIEAVTDGTFKYIVGTGSAPTDEEFYFANGTDYTPIINDVKEIYISTTNIEGQTVTFADVVDGSYLRFNFSGDLYLFICNTDPTFNSDYVLFNVDLIEADGATPSQNDQAVVSTLHITGIDVNDLEQQLDTRYVKLTSGTKQTVASDIDINGDVITTGDVRSGERNPAATDARGVRIAVDSSNGGVYAQATSSSTPSALMAFQALHGTDEKFKVTYDGTGTFGGNVLANDGVGVDGGASLSTGLYYRDDSEKYGVALYSGGSAQNNRKAFIKTDGSASFASGIRSLGDAYAGISEGVLLNGGPDRDFPGSIDVCRDGATELLWKGWQKGIGTPTSQIRADGDATFAGKVESDKYFTVDRDTDSASAALYLGFAKGDQKFKVGVDGTAIFGGATYYTSDTNVQVTGDNNLAKLTLNSPTNITFSLSANKTDGSNGDFVIRDESNATDRMIISNTGMVEFPGDIQVGGNPHDATGVNLRTLGLIKVARPGTNAVWAGYTTGVSSATSEIFANGSATFKGAVQIGDYDPYAPDGDDRGVYLFETGGLVTNVSASSSATTRLWAGMQDGVPSSYIEAGGSATFAGNIMSGNFKADGTDKGVWVRESGVVQVSSPAGSSNALQVFKGGVGETVSIKNDGSATFANLLSVTGGGISCQYGPITLYAGSGPDFGAKVSLQTDGSASFNGTIASSYSPTQGGYCFVMNDPSNPGRTSGGLYQKDGGASTLFLKASWDTRTTINLDGESGSGRFDGGVTAGAGTYTGAGVTASFSGNVYIQGTPTDVTNNAVALSVVNPTDYNAPKVTITHAGSATFAGTVKGNSSNAEAIAGEFTSDSTSDSFPVIQARNFEDTGTVFQGRKADGAITSSIKASGAATFVGDPSNGLNNGLQIRNTGEVVIKSGVTDALTLYGSGANKAIRLVSNGDALFVGKVTSSNITAFKTALTTAVASASDLNTLKQAILDAVNDL